jgi:hypothetical protein
LLHGELAIVRGEEWVGVVVGHVLDEPENLPFLPWSRPYLAALGAGAPRISGEESLMRSCRKVEEGIPVIAYG